MAAGDCRAGLAVWGWRILNPPLPQYRTLVVRKGDLQQSVLATGKLDALKSGRRGAGERAAKTLRVEIGDKVKRPAAGGLSTRSRRKTR